MDFDRLADMLYPDNDLLLEELEKMYPPRGLPQGAMVTRMAPSPTGFMHLGNLFGALTDERLAHQSGGVFFLRIEDTDQKREVPGGVETILKAFESFDLNFDEGATLDGENGKYGPYRQRQRARIYQAVAKSLIRRGLAYPCFCTEEELGEMRRRQEEQKATPGYYGRWARHRDMGMEDTEKELAAGKPFVLRLRSPGDPNRRIVHIDEVKGRIEMPENDQDVVLLKSDGIPTYHFAHVVDDHFMRTTHVVRGEEWLATLPIHLQLFELLGWQKPKYVHTAQLMKMDGGSKRKLSKRKDPELALDFYSRAGYPVESVLEYLMTLLNSNYEEWRLKNPTAPMTDFQFKTKKMGVSGALFDIAKLDDISRNTVAVMDAPTVYGRVAGWAKDNAPEFYGIFTRDGKYSTDILAIGRGGPKPRKDIGLWSDAVGYTSFFFDELAEYSDNYPENVSKEDILAILTRYADIYDEKDDNTAWFDKVKQLAESMGYAPAPKLYKQDPDAWKGHVGDVSMVLRVAVTGRTNSPDMCAVMGILGRERVLGRLKAAADRLKSDRKV